MNIQEPLEEQLREIGSAPVSDPPIDRIVARGRRRRGLRSAVTAAVVAVFALLVALPLIPFVQGTLADKPPAMSSHNPPPLETPIAGATAASPGAPRQVPVGLGVAIQAPSNWSILVQPNLPGAPGDASLLQLTNFDPGLFLQGGPPDAADLAWRCPLADGGVPDDGALLIVRMTTADRAPATEPSWPVDLQEGSGSCGAGSVAQWRFGDRGFDAFAAFGANASSVDRAALTAAFQSLRFDVQPDAFLVLSEDESAVLPQQILAAEIGPDGFSMQTVYPESVDAPSGWCQGVWRATTAHLHLDYAHEPFAAVQSNECSNVEDLPPSLVADVGYGGTCSGEMSLEGFIRADIVRAFVRMDDGTEAPLWISSPPAGLKTGNQNLVAGSYPGGQGTFIGVQADGTELRGQKLTC